MKRSGLKRKSGLKADPEKTRAFVERAQQAARDDDRRQQDEARARLARGEALDGSQVVPAGQARRASAGARRAAATALPPVIFRARRPAREMHCAWPRCTRWASSWHHWLPQSALKVYVRGLRLEEPAERRLLRRLLRDEANLSPFCDAHHGQHGSSAHDYPRSMVPGSALDFARELGPEWHERVLRLYPVRAA